MNFLSRTFYSVVNTTMGFYAVFPQRCYQTLPVLLARCSITHTESGRPVSPAYFAWQPNPLKTELSQMRCWNITTIWSSRGSSPRLSTFTFCSSLLGFNIESSTYSQGNRGRLWMQTIAVSTREEIQQERHGKTASTNMERSSISRRRSALNAESKSPILLPFTELPKSLPQGDRLPYLSRW